VPVGTLAVTCDDEFLRFRLAQKTRRTSFASERAPREPIASRVITNCKISVLVYR